MKKFAVFDIDGTLIRWQLYHAVVDKLAKQGLLGEQVHEKLHQARMAWKERASNDAFSQYEQVIITAFEAALPNIDPKAFDQLVTIVIREYQNQVYTYTRNLINTLKAQNYFLIAISGSHHELIEKLARYYGFDVAVGSKYERNDKNFSGKKFIPSLDKGKVLSDLITEYGLSKINSYGIGDSSSDAPVLSMIEHPIAFNPDRSLFEVAKKKAWQIIIERKNMIYKLESHDGHYILA